MNDSRAKFECRKWRKADEDQYSIKLEGYLDDMTDLTAMTIVTLAEQHDFDLGMLLTLIKVKASVFNKKKQVIHGKTARFNKFIMDEFINELINKGKEAEEDGRE